MKRLYSILIAVVVLMVFASPALADPGTTWEKQFSTLERFEVLTQFGGQAVFDKETGRVWERSPSTSTFNWAIALEHCYVRTVGGRLGGRKGWRLPTIEELASLVDRFNTNPALPTGHPFNVQLGDYWSATTRLSSASNTTANAWVVSFDTGDVHGAIKNLDRPVWCVRGGQGIVGP